MCDGIVFLNVFFILNVEMYLVLWNWVHQTWLFFISWSLDPHNFSQCHNSFVFWEILLDWLFNGFINYVYTSFNFATLALGSQSKQGFTREWVEREARECGRMWEWTFTLPNELPLCLGVRLLVDSQKFRERLQGSKPLALWSPLYHWKAIET
jgi:hypothetical protein